MSEWVPISERLPQDGTDVLVTICQRGRRPYVRSAEYFRGFFRNEEICEYAEAKECKVKAWMIPEPYEGDVIYNCENCKHYGEDLHGANCRFCQDMNLWEVKDALTIIEAYKSESEDKE